MPAQFFTYWKLHRTSILLVCLSLLFYAVFAYDLERDDFAKLITLFAALFFLCFKLVQFEKWNFNFLLIAGLFFRLVFIIAEPNLSQDFYRFIWDGELIKNGINPYIYTPNEIMESSQLVLNEVGAFQIENSKILFDGMGELSARHFSNYPPLNQIIFAIASFLGNGSILGSLIVMRLFVIGADLGILYFGRKLIQNLGASNHLAFWYFLNPLVIIELTGNLHFEGVMLFLFVWSLYLISQQKWKLAAPVYGLAIALKLVPLLFLPLFLKHFGLKKSVLFYLLVGITCSIVLLPFYSPIFIDNYSKTVGLWFSNFEFNAGIYNLVKKIGVNFYEAKPWELVKSYGSLVPKIVIVIALLLTFFRQNHRLKTLLTSMLILLTCYYLLSATVHPWYIIFLVVLSVFTDYRFPMVWSAAVVLSYFAYSNADYDEHLGLLAIEYILVFGYLGYEISKNNNIKARFRKKAPHN